MNDYALRMRWFSCAKSGILVRVGDGDWDRDGDGGSLGGDSLMEK